MKNVLTCTVELTEARARLALERKEFTVVYQPKFDLRTMQTVGAEALVRWITPEGQTVRPDEFIPFFEENGLVEELDFLVLAQTCRMLRGCLDRGMQAVPVSVNFSRGELSRPGFAARLWYAVAAWELPAALIQVEVTERACPDGEVPLAETVRQLRQAGFTVAVDDFGTGCTGEAELRTMPVDVIKLDRSFLNRTDKVSAIRRAIRLARELGLRVVAEGVETLQDVQLLWQCGCGVGQGYYYARPLNRTDFLALLMPCSAAV